MYMCCRFLMDQKRLLEQVGSAVMIVRTTAQCFLADTLVEDEKLPWPRGYLHPVTVHDPLILRLPTGRHEDQQLAEAITTAVIWLAFVWVAYKLWAFGRQKGKKE